MIEAEWWEYDSLDELADAVAGDVGFIVDSAVEARGASLVALPGGKTGPAIFPKLAAQQLPWKRVTIIPTDERLVPMNDERSNVRELARVFLPVGASPALVDKLHGAVDATVRSPEVAKKFTELGADPQFGAPKEFAAYVANDMEKWARVAKDAGLKAE